MRTSLAIASGIAFTFPAVGALPGIEVRRGADTMVYGNCVPSLVVENRSAETVDYLQVDLLVTLMSGERRSLELKSAYREGILFPIAPGKTAVLRQHLDTSRALGVSCDRIKTREVLRVMCQAAGGGACVSPIMVEP